MNVDLVDGVEYLAVCPHTKVIALYSEGIRRGRRFMEAVRQIVPHKPIVALYAGGSETGKQAGFSHTGAMAGPDPLYGGMFRQCGVLRARSMTEMFDFCWVLGTMPPPSGARVMIQTHSGGPGVSAADACGRAGLEMPSLSTQTQERLTHYVPQTASIANPIDLTYTKNPMHYFSEIPEALVQEPDGDMLLVYFMFPSHRVQTALKVMGFSEEQAGEETDRLIEAQCNTVERILQEYEKPIVGYTYRSLQEPLIQGLIRRGIPVFPGPERAAEAMGCLVRYVGYRDELRNPAGLDPAAAAPSGLAKSP
jgi:acyl-CoA synthetase (NDP forming)